MARLLITGASGLLGANLVLEARGEHAVTAVAFRHPIHAARVDSFEADLSEPGSAEALFEQVRPEWVIHGAAATNLDRCEADSSWAYRLNRDMAGHVAKAARESGARLVHISTDAVFDGEQGGYSEEALPRPLSVYGDSKLAGEKVVLEACPDALVVRTNLFGWNATDKRSLSEWFLAGLEGKDTLIGFADVEFSPILVNQLGRILFLALQGGLTGLYHIAGSTCLTKYDFGVRLAEATGHSLDHIRPGRVAESGLQAPRAKRLCLNGGKIERDLGIRLPTIDSGIHELIAMKSDGRMQTLKGMARPTDQESVQ